MTISHRYKLLTCLMLYVCCVQGIMVKFGTKGGPIEPPTPEPEVVPVKPYRAPAPVWEERSNDTPDPNAQWRPQLFIPQPRYTQVIYRPPQQSNAQRFVSAYLPEHKPIKAQPVQNYLTPSQILSSQSLPGVGIRYFQPAYVNELQQRKNVIRQEDAKHNDVETNDINVRNTDGDSDLLWKYEKEATKRTTRHTLEGTAPQFVYQWPAYVSRHH